MHVIAIVLHFSLIQKWSRQRLVEEDISSPVTQSRQEVYDGYLLSDADVTPFPGLCPVFHGPQLCLLPKLCVATDGGRGPQMHDPSGPLCLLSPAGSQQLGAVPRGAPLEPDRRHGTPGHTGG